MPRASRGDALARFRWLFAFIALLLVGLAAVWMVQHGAMQTADRLAEAARHAAVAAEQAAKNFKTGTITERFIASVPEMEKTAGENMEVAVLHATETFTKNDSLKVFWETLDLGMTTTRVTVPVTYRYHIHLNDAWSLEEKERVCIVRAPAIRATLPPAIHTDAMNVETSAGWARWNGSEQLAEVVKTITPRVSELAENKARSDFAVRQAARQKVGEFVRDWILKDQKGREELNAVVVVFPDDLPETMTSPERMPLRK